MGLTFETADWREHRMTYAKPFEALETDAEEVAVVADALAFLRDADVLPEADYDRKRFEAFRRGVGDGLEIPWTAICPRMQRLIWAINAIRRPRRMVAAGVFCGFTFLCNAGAAAGPGAVYEAEDLVGVEIKPDEAARAERNVRRIDPTGCAHIVAADAVAFCRDYEGPIDLLYLDADGTAETGKGVYLDILEAALPKLSSGALVLAHNSINCASRLSKYLSFVRGGRQLRQSVNVCLDPEGLEVSIKR